LRGFITHPVTGNGHFCRSREAVGLLLLGGAKRGDIDVTFLAACVADLLRGTFSLRNVTPAVGKPAALKSSSVTGAFEIPICVPFVFSYLLVMFAPDVKKPPERLLD
jgi:hypothetical protein